MGAQQFIEEAVGKTAKEAFQAAVSTAQYECGHGGYTGTIAEKHDFRMIPIAGDRSPHDVARAMLDADDRRVCDKWGPAGCIALGGDRWLFFGWASC